MKYLKIREDFLNKQKFSNYNPSNEDSGPLANEIPWGDTLLGRLINSVIRKVQIGVDLVRMDAVIERLNEQFNILLTQGTINGSKKSDEINLQVDKALISSILGIFRKTIEDTDDIKEVKKAGNACIQDLQNLSLSKGSQDLRNELVEKIKEFLSSLKEEGESKGEEKTESKDKSQLMLTNLGHLLNILNTLTKPSEEKKKETFDRSNVKEKSFYLANYGSKNHIVYVQKIEGDKVTVVPFLNGKRQNPIQIELKSIFKSVRYEVTPSKDGKTDSIKLNKEDTKIASPMEVVLAMPKGAIASKGVVESILFESEETNIDPAKEKLKKSAELLVKNDKGLSINPAFIQELINSYKTSPNDKGKDGVLNSPSYIITNLYKEIYSCLKGDRAGTIPDIGKLTESIEDLKKDRSKIAVAGELIARFSKRTAQFEENSLYQKLGDLGNEVHGFNISLKEIFDSGMELPDYRKEKENKEEPKKESLMRYSNFILLKEADEEVKTETEEKPKTEEKSDKKEPEFRITFNKIFNADYLNKWIMTKEEIDAINKELSSIPKDSTRIIIEGIDPILEIVKIFNRAYRLYQVESIPSGRQDGRVSERTKREYEYMGGEATPHGYQVGGKGPWRNKALFEKWESAVMDIIKDSKYQVLFNQDTVIKVGSADARFNVEKGDEGYAKKQGGGKTLLTFINALLDGSKMYKGGAQSAFIKEYFDVEVKDDSLGYTLKGKNDNKRNSKVAEDSVKDTGKKKYSFKPVKDVSPEFTKSFYALKAGDKKYYMYLTGADENYVYVKYSESFFPIDKFVSGIADISKGDMDTIQERERRKSDNSKFETYYGRILKKKFPIAPGSEIDLRFLNLQNYELADNKDEVKSETGKLGKIDKVYAVLKEDGKLFILPEDKAKSVSSKDDKYKEKLK